VLTKDATDRFAEPVGVARKLLNHAYLLGKKNRPAGQSGAQYAREELDKLGIGADLTAIPWGPSRPPIPMPPSRQVRCDASSLPAGKKGERRPKQVELVNSR
jgi:hypothetical protein